MISDIALTTGSGRTFIDTHPLRTSRDCTLTDARHDLDAYTAVCQYHTSRLHDRHQIEPFVWRKASNAQRPPKKITACNDAAERPAATA
jgi:hypothetical protein